MSVTLFRSRKRFCRGLAGRQTVLLNRIVFHILAERKIDKFCTCSGESYP